MPNRNRADKTTYRYFLVGLFLALLPWGLQLIGVTVNLWLGGIILAVAFGLMIYAFWIWESPSRWHIYLRIATIIVAAGLYSAFVGRQIIREWQNEHPSDSSARIRVIDVVLVPMSQSGAAFPALNIYYDNVGPRTAKGVVSRFGAGFGGSLSDEAILAQQDNLLHWDGWKSAMDRRKQNEMHPGDPGEFTSIPNMEGVLASQFRQNLDKVSAGTTVLYVFITFKFFDPSGRIGVTENCFWFSGGFARHNCGRGRTFLEQRA